jgi:hypothetical protein
VLFPPPNSLIRIRSISGKVVVTVVVLVLEAVEGTVVFVDEESAETLKAVVFAAEESAETLTAVVFVAEESAETLKAVAFAAEESAETLTAVVFVAEESAETLKAVVFVAEESAETLTAVVFVAEESAETLKAVVFVAEESAETLTAVVFVEFGFILKTSELFIAVEPLVSLETLDSVVNNFTISMSDSFVEVFAVDNVVVILVLALLLFPSSNKFSSIVIDDAK